MATNNQIAEVAQQSKNAVVIVVIIALAALFVWGFNDGKKDTSAEKTSIEVNANH